MSRDPVTIVTYEWLPEFPRGFVRDIRARWAALMEEDLAPPKDAKTALQEWAHRQGGLVPVYVVDSREGPDHDPLFAVSVTVGKRPPEQGTGRSKRAAEQEAATRLLVREGEWKEGE